MSSSLSDLRRRFFGAQSSESLPDAEMDALTLLDNLGVDFAEQLGVDPLNMFSTGEAPIPRVLLNGTYSHVTGLLKLTAFTAKRTETINSVRIISTNPAAAATPTLIRIGIYAIDSAGDGTLVASTANDTTLLAALNTRYTKALSAPFSKVAGTRYACGLLVVTGATAPSVACTLPVSSGTAGGGFSELNENPWVHSALVSQADLPASFAKASFGSTSSGLGATYFYLAT